MSASGFTEVLVAIYLAVGAPTESDMPRFARDGEIQERPCGAYACDWDDGSPECAVERSRGKQCERSVERLIRMQMMEDALAGPEHPDKYCSWNSSGIKRCGKRRAATRKLVHTAARAERSADLDPRSQRVLETPALKGEPCRPMRS